MSDFGDTARTVLSTRDQLMRMVADLGPDDTAVLLIAPPPKPGAPPLAGARWATFSGMPTLYVVGLLTSVLAFFTDVCRGKNPTGE